MSTPTDPGLRAADDALRPAESLAEAVENLRDAYTANGAYPAELVTDALRLIDDGADEVAQYERDRWARWFDHTADNGRHLGEHLRSGMRWAAGQLRHNRARFDREGTPTA